MIKPVLFLVGPTASGKTELSLCLAKRLGGEIVSADSMLVYRGMDIGTAKPSREERRRVRHHLINLLSCRSNFSVYLHRKRALQAIEEILKQGRLPLVVGGGGLYLKALWRGISPPLGGNAQLRKRISEEAKGKGPPFLYERLRKIDPRRAEALHPHDERRIVRALEIATLSGKIPSEWYGEEASLAQLGFSVRLFGIARDRADLYERINRRVEKMFRKGFLHEVKRLKRRGFSKTARQALGYREALEYLNQPGRGGVTPPLPLVRLVQKRTRQFAKRQLSWLRREKEIRWVRWAKGESASQVGDKILKEIGSWPENGLGW